MGRQVLVQSEVGSVTEVASSATVVTLLAAKPNRLGAIISNESTAVLAIKLGAGAALDDYTVKLGPTASSVPTTWEVPFGYTGIITGIWAAANGNAYVTELT